MTLSIDLSAYGTCAKSATVSVDSDGKIGNIRMDGGCPGWSKAICAVSSGLPVIEFIERLRDVTCGGHLSCAGALATELAKEVL